MLILLKDRAKLWLSQQFCINCIYWCDVMIQGQAVGMWGTTVSWTCVRTETASVTHEESEEDSSADTVRVQNHSLYSKCVHTWSESSYYHIHVAMMVWCCLSVFSSDITLKYNVSCEFCSGIGDCIQTNTETTCKCPYPYFGKKLSRHSYLDYYLSNKIFCVTYKILLVIITLYCAIWICTRYLYVLSLNCLYFMIQVQGVGRETPV